MNIYDTANRLASEIKQSEEYVNYKMAKEALNLKCYQLISLCLFQASDTVHAPLECYYSFGFSQ